jgi:hypothetical protein
MNTALRTRLAGVGTALGAVVLSSIAWVGCQPGSLPCDQDDWQKICEGNGVSVATTGGSSGGSGGSGGGGGASNMGGNGGTAPVGDIGAKMIANCSMFATVKDMDKFFDMRCGKNATCHGAGSGFGEIHGPDFYKMAPTLKTKFACANTVLADTGDYKNGMLWRKIQPVPACGGSGAGLTRMPSMPDTPLTDAETKCLEGFLQALVK